MPSAAVWVACQSAGVRGRSGRPKFNRGCSLVCVLFRCSGWPVCPGRVCLVSPCPWAALGGLSGLAPVLPGVGFWLRGSGLPCLWCSCPLSRWRSCFRVLLSGVAAVCSGCRCCVRGLLPCLWCPVPPAALKRRRATTRTFYINENVTKMYHHAFYHAFWFTGLTKLNRCDMV